MDYTIKRFNDSLDKSINRIQGDIVRRASSRPQKNLLPSDDVDIERISQRKMVKRIINVPEYKWESHGEIFLNFAELSEMLDEVGLSVAEKAEIVFFMFKKNLATKIAEQKVEGFDFRKLSKYPFVHTTFDEVKDLLCSDWYRNAQANNGANLSAEDKIKYDEIEKAIGIYTLDITSVVEQHKLIKEHYFDKQPNLSKEDIQIVASVFRTYNLSEKIINEIIGYLTNKTRPYMTRFIDELGGLSDQVFTMYKSGINNLFDQKNLLALSKLFVASSLHCWLNYPVEAEQSKTVFGNFGYIETVFGKKFKEKDYTQVVLEIARRNIEIGILSESKREVGMDFSFTNPSLFRPSNLPRFRDTFDRFYRDCTLAKTDEKGVKGVTHTDLDNYWHVQFAHQQLKDHYFDKIDTFDREDVLLICLGLSKVGISIKYLALIEKDLYGIIEEREAKLTEPIVEEVTTMVDEALEKKEKEGTKEIVVVPEKPRLSKKAYNEIYREMRTYFDFNEMKSIRYLTLDEILYCMSLMKKVDISEERIREFIRKAEKANRSYEVNPITRYVELLNKLEYYSSNEKIMELLTELKEAYASIIPGENDPFYEEFIASGLKEILSLIPDTHEYEFNAYLRLIDKVD